jgi:hypothetical protein
MHKFSPCWEEVQKFNDEDENLLSERGTVRKIVDTVRILR